MLLLLLLLLLLLWQRWLFARPVGNDSDGLSPPLSSSSSSSSWARYAPSAAAAISRSDRNEKEKEKKNVKKVHFYLFHLRWWWRPTWRSLRNDGRMRSSFRRFSLVGAVTWSTVVTDPTVPGHVIDVAADLIGAPRTLVRRRRCAVFFLVFFGFAVGRRHPRDNSVEAKTTTTTKRKKENNNKK